MVSLQPHLEVTCRPSSPEFSSHMYVSSTIEATLSWKHELRLACQSKHGFTGGIHVSAIPTLLSRQRTISQMPLHEPICTSCGVVHHEIPKRPNLKALQSFRVPWTTWETSAVLIFRCPPENPRSSRPIILLAGSDLKSSPKMSARTDVTILHDPDQHVRMHMIWPGSIADHHTCQHWQAVQDEQSWHRLERFRMDFTRLRSSILAA